MKKFLSIIITLFSLNANSQIKNLAEKLSSSLEKTNNQVLKLTTLFSLILEN